MQLFFGAKCKKSILFFAAELPNHGIGFTVRADCGHGIFTDLQSYILKQKHIFLSIILCCFRFYRIAVHGKRNRVRIGIHFYGDVLPFAYREAARSYVGYGVFAPIGLVKQIPHKTAYSRRSVCRRPARLNCSKYAAGLRAQSRPYLLFLHRSKTANR